MGGNAQPVIRDIFPLVGALAAPARLRVGELLFTPASSPALLADEVLALPLPRGDDDRAALCRSLQAGLDRDVLVRLSGSRLGEVVPAIDGRAGFVGAPPWPARLQGVMARSASQMGLPLGFTSTTRSVAPNRVAAIRSAMSARSTASPRSTE